MSTLDDEQGNSNVIQKQPVESESNSSNSTSFGKFPKEIMW